MNPNAQSQTETAYVQVNGEQTSMDLPMTLPSLLAQLGYEQGAYAVAVNEHFVARSHYESTEIVAGDRIEIVAPMQGG